MENTARIAKLEDAVRALTAALNTLDPECVAESQPNVTLCEEVRAAAKQATEALEMSR
jgi:hypothetical protein